MGRFSFQRVILMALGGAFGGILTWILLDPSISRQEADRSAGGTYTHIALFGVVIGVCIGCSLVLVDEIRSGNALRIGLMLLRGIAAGAVCGLVGAVAGQIVFGAVMTVIRTAAMVAGDAVTPFIVFARTVGWALMGAGAGICVGAVSTSTRRCMQGIVGGIVGGGIGGFLFDFLAGATQGGSTSRAVGFVCMGAAIGAAVSVIEEAVKDAWVTVLTGAKEGRSFILSKDQTTIGRNEMADIPLFGDASIQGNHAVILKSGDGYTITAAPGVFIAVNSQNVNSAGLADGDIISVGKQRMRFSSSGRRARVPVGVVQPVQQYVQTIPPAQNAQGYAYGEQTAISASRLQVLSGPHSGEVFNLNQSGGPMVLGRDPSSDIPLARDGMVSRRHAIILWDGGAWIIEDSGSTNGVFVNGTRVPRETLRPGSSIHVGESDIRVL